MRFQAAILGCLAILSTALPAVERREEPTLAITNAPGETALSLSSTIALYTATQTAITDASSLTALEKRARKKKTSTSSKKKTSKTKPKKKKKKRPTKSKTKAAKATKTKAAKATKTKGAKATKTKGAKATKTKGAKATKTKGAKATKTRAAKATKTRGAKATKTRGAKATKTKPVKPTSTGKLGTFKVCAKKSCGLDKKSLGCKAPPASTGNGKKGGKKGKGSTKKTTAAGRARRALESIGEHALNYFFRRNDVKLTLDSNEIAALLKKAKSSQSDQNRYLAPSTPGPNDMSYDAFTTSQPFYRQTDNLEGCTAVVVTTPKGVFMWHIWENPSINPLKKDPAKWDAQTKEMSDDVFKKLVLDQVAHGVSGKVTTKAGAMTFGNQFGLKDTSKVPADNWSDLSKVKIAIMTPNVNRKGGGVNVGAGVIPKASWKTKLRYGRQIDELVTKIKSTIGHVGARNIQVWGYHSATPNPGDVNNVHNTDANGKATVAWDGNSYAVYLEGKKMFMEDVEPAE